MPGKFCEKSVCNQMFWYLDQNHVLSLNQHGFRSGHSMETALMELSAQRSRSFVKLKNNFGPKRDRWITPRVTGSAPAPLPWNVCILFTASRQTNAGLHHTIPLLNQSLVFYSIKSTGNISTQKCSYETIFHASRY